MSHSLQMARRAVIVWVYNVQQQPKKKVFQDRVKANAFIKTLKGPLTIEVESFATGRILRTVTLKRGERA